MFELLEESYKELESQFYKDRFYFSYSSITKLLWNPAVFHSMYVLGLGRNEQKTDTMIKGSLIHCMILEPDKIQERYLVSDIAIPTANTKAVVDRVYKQHIDFKTNNATDKKDLKEYESIILEVLKYMNLHQSLSTDKQRIAKILTPDAISYWNFLVAKEGKMLIDRATLDYCASVAEVFKQDSEICKTLGIGITDFDNVEVFNELELQWAMTKTNIGLKGVVDNIKIDHNHKMITINDIKTTSKDLNDFSESVEHYSYWLQTIIYLKLVYTKFYDLYPSYNYEFNFIVVDRNTLTYIFRVSQDTLIEWFDRFDGILKIVRYHYDKNDFLLPYKFATKSVIL
jgi:hypothetical protein